jgi:basic amino acid/polyamine antiporter, APA family
MNEGWRRKIGDRIIHPRRTGRFHLKRSLGVIGLFSAGYGDVGSSIYYGLGLVAIVALGATPIVLAIAGLIYVTNALTYAEGGAMIPEAGGSASFARRAFNDMVGFASGWALLLSYVATMALSAYTIPPYLAYFWPVLNESSVGTLVSIGIIAFLMLINVIGVRESTRINVFFVALAIVTQVSLVVLGIILILGPNPGILFEHMFGAGNWPSTGNLIYGIAIAALCFTGVETVSQLAEETLLPSKRIPRAYFMMIAAILIIFAGISIVALSSMTPQALGDSGPGGWARDPVAGIVANLPSETMRTIYAPLVSILAATILLVAANAGLLGMSRLVFNMSSHKQFPAVLSKIHSTFRTPYIAIFIFCTIAMIILLPGIGNAQGFFSNLGALYVFGDLLCFAFAHLAILRLRMTEPDLPRPFKLGLNIQVGGKKLPINAILGLLATLSIWLVVIIIQPYSRWAGFIWMAIGVVVYVVFRWRRHLPLFRLPPAKTPAVPERQE